MIKRKIWPVVCILLLCGLLLPLFAACQTGEKTDDTTEKDDTVTTALSDPEKLELLTTADLVLQDGVLSTTVESSDPVFDFTDRITVGRKSSWVLTSDAGGNNVVSDRKITLVPGDNICYIKVTYQEESKVYQATIHYSEVYRVSFYANLAAPIPTQKVQPGEVAARPADPTREGYQFLGWFDGGTAYDFSSPVRSDKILISHWQKLSTEWTYDDSGVHLTDTVAQMAIVWKDYDNKNGLRPETVTCMLTESDGTTEKSYPVTVSKTSVAWSGEQPAAGTLSRGEGGDWTVRISGLPTDKTYTFTQVDEDAPYTTQQVGTSAVNTIENYVPSIDRSASLTTRNGRLYDAAGNLVVLQGVVTLNVGVNGYETGLSERSLAKLKAAGTNCIRVTVQLVGVTGAGYVYHTNGSSRTGDYSESDERTTENIKTQMREKLDFAVTNATKLGMYVIIDWGILTSNPYQYLSDAKEFFGLIAEQYASNPYVLYELCNEPKATWGESNGTENSIRKYGEAVIESIREAGSSAVIILAPNESATNISNRYGDDPIHDPLDDEHGWNVAYTFHCYPGNYTYENYDWIYGWRIRDAHDAGLTVVVTEFSPMDGTFGTADPLSFDMQETAKYLRLFREWDIGYCYFRFASAISSDAVYHENLMFRPYIDLALYDWTEADMTECGKWYYHIITGDGVLTAPDYTTTPMKLVRPNFSTIFSDYGLASVFPGFAIGGEKTGDVWCFITGSDAVLSDTLYSCYCKALFEKISSASDTGRAYAKDGTTIYNADNLPATTADALEAVYRYNGKNISVSVKFGENPTGNGYGLLVEICEQ